ncbi:siderophore-interacting protein [Clostridium sp. MB40-C1]|uniref:siderophore-interacting protein n=1 Tax=Clostridium sp. MB40-C1 TaxID=3070996 RepID=UPI0027DF58E0|nr:siderophore-interacting protein [Clostridium sp. MB40-C1]WMJ81959.1 siderophore-interacting protein [Clostridium sp. MB40-C1]
MTGYTKVQIMLNSYILWVNDVKNLELEIEALKNDYDLRGIQYQEKTGATNKINKEIEDRINSKEDKIKVYEKQKRFNEINIEKINNAVEILSEFEKTVIELKYLTSPTLSWKGIAYKVNSGTSTCRQAKIRAINKMIPLLCR